MATSQDERRSVVSVTRSEDGSQDRFRAYHLVIDGHRRGKLKRGQTVEATVEPGPHSICMTIDWCSSKTLEILALPGGRIELACHPVSNATAITQSLVTASRDNYIILERTSG